LTATLTDHDRDAQWHGKVRDALGEHWRCKDGKKQSTADAQPASPLPVHANGRLA
jgi:pullulanase/glycogen debranching enzyme